jgi:hypothetical protein
MHPRMELVRGTVQAADVTHTHFWNVLARADGSLWHVDLTWSQFPAGAWIRDFEILDRDGLGDSPATVARCNLLLHRVLTAMRTSAPT